MFVSTPSKTRTDVRPCLRWRLTLTNRVRKSFVLVFKRRSAFSFHFNECLLGNRFHLDKAYTGNFRKYGFPAPIFLKYNFAVWLIVYVAVTFKNCDETANHPPWFLPEVGAICHSLTYLLSPLFHRLVSFVFLTPKMCPKFQWLYPKTEMPNTLCGAKKALCLVTRHILVLARIVTRSMTHQKC